MSALCDTADVKPIIRCHPYLLQHVMIDFWDGSRDLSAFSYGDMLRILSFCYLYHRICLSCEDESSLPSQKLIVTCCSRYGVEMDYQLDICHVTKGGHKQHLWGGGGGIWSVSLSICRSHVKSGLPFKCTNFMKYVRELWITPYLSTCQWS
jgi:hypothetical protein